MAMNRRVKNGRLTASWPGKIAQLNRTTDSRWERGRQIAEKGSQIRKLGFGDYEVRSQRTHHWEYVVSKKGSRGWACTCPDYVRRHKVCKHVWAVIHFFILKRRPPPPENDLHGPDETDNLLCPNCDSPVHNLCGKRPTEVRGDVQRYQCKACHHKYITPSAFTRMKATPLAITVAMDLHFKGLSLNEICDHLAQFCKLAVTHVAVMKWIRKYVALMKEFTDRLVPNASSLWHADEMVIHIKRTTPINMGAKGQRKKVYGSWAWNLIDRETRYLLASLILKRRNTQSAQRLFRAAKAAARSVPAGVVHDGLRAYDKAHTREFYTNRSPQVANIRTVGASKKGFNMVVERLNGTIRRREKVMRGMHSEVTAQAQMDEFQQYYNHLRPHKALGGRTPAQRAGIDLGLRGNRVEGLISKAYASKREKARTQASMPRVGQTILTSFLQGQ